MPHHAPQEYPDPTYGTFSSREVQHELHQSSTLDTASSNYYFTFCPPVHGSSCRHSLAASLNQTGPIWWESRALSKVSWNKSQMTRRTRTMLCWFSRQKALTLAPPTVAGWKADHLPEILCSVRRSSGEGEQTVSGHRVQWGRGWGSRRLEARSGTDPGDRPPQASVATAGGYGESQVRYSRAVSSLWRPSSPRWTSASNALTYSPGSVIVLSRVASSTKRCSPRRVPSSLNPS